MHYLWHLQKTFIKLHKDFMIYTKFRCFLKKFWLVMSINGYFQFFYHTHIFPWMYCGRQHKKYLAAVFGHFSMMHLQSRTKKTSPFSHQNKLFGLNKSIWARTTNTTFSIGEIHSKRGREIISRRCSSHAVRRWEPSPWGSAIGLNKKWLLTWEWM